MPNFDLSHQPRFDVVTIDTDSPITEERLLQVLDHGEGVTICLRSSEGHQNRGGHFFCIQRDTTNGLISLETIEQEFVDTFSLVDMVRFINHAAGLAFDREMQLYCQNGINFRTD